MGKANMEQKSKKDTELQNGDKAGYRLVMENENYADSFNQKRHGTNYQQHFILMLCLMILGLLCFLIFNNQVRNGEDKFDRDAKEKFMEELLKDLIKTDLNENSVTNIERVDRSRNSQNGWRVDEYSGGEQQQNHCLRSYVRTRCTDGPGRRLYNTGPRNIWDPAFEEDFGEDPHWNCHHCCLHQGKTLDACPAGEEYVVDHEVEDNEYHEGWRVDSYGNGARVEDTEKLNVSITVCGSATSGSRDWVWLEFKTDRGAICKTTEDFNRRSQLSTNGKTKTFPWRSMGECDHLRQYDRNLQFRLRSRKQNGIAWYNEIKICKLTLATNENIYRWRGETACEGAGSWQTMRKYRIQ